jgi:hypothetical protein
MDWYIDFVLSMYAEEKLSKRQPLSSREARAWVNQRIREIALEDSRRAIL